MRLKKKYPLKHSNSGTVRKPLSGFSSMVAYAVKSSREISNRQNLNIPRIEEASLCLLPTTIPFWDLLSLANWLGTSIEVLKNIIGTPQAINSCYSTFYIDKNTKKIVPQNYGLNLREINSPHPGLKVWLQKLVGFFQEFPVHPANYAFTAGRNIKMAAESVKDGGTLIHLDLKDFFGGNTSLWAVPVLTKLIKEKYGEQCDAESLAKILVKLCFYNNKLPQGAPTSPILTVILNYDLDMRLCKLGMQYGLIYSRYADDLLFSGNLENSKISSFMKNLSDAVHPHVINWSKLNIMRESTFPIMHGLTIKTSLYTPTSQMAVISAKVVQFLKDKFGLNFTGEDYKLTQTAHTIQVEFSKKVDIPLDTVKPILQELKNGIITKYPRLSEIVVKPMFFYVQSVKTALGLHLTKGEVKYPRKKYRELRLLAMLMGRQRALQSLKYQCSRSAPSTYSFNYSSYMFVSTTSTSNYFNPYQAFDSSSSLSLLTSVLERSAQGVTTLVTHKQFRNLLSKPLRRKVFNGKVAYLTSIDPEKGAKIKAIEQKAYDTCLEDIKLMLCKNKAYFVSKDDLGEVVNSFNSDEARVFAINSSVTADYTLVYMEEENDA